MTEDERQEHVIVLVNQINGVLGGEGVAETATALTLSVICHIVATSRSAEERAQQAGVFARQVEDYLRREDIVEWIRANTTSFPKPGRMS
jgi:3,4-dihydroxy-2-butanone 4-phosphate synthase